jgi:hypothetical protein
MIFRTQLGYFFAFGVMACPLEAAAQREEDAMLQIAGLEQRLRTTQYELERLQQQVDALVSEVAAARSLPAEDAQDARAAPTDTLPRGGPSAIAATMPVEGPEIESGPPSYQERILVTELGGDERADALTARPELFVQTRYQSAPIDDATSEDVTRNFALSRMELRWAGRVTERVGLGFEVQYHPAVEGAADELVNDAFAEYYVTEAITLRAGQFVKPFGFDIQHSSSARESPERGIFAGYFFPGQRDRGMMAMMNLGQLAPRLGGTSLYIGAFNGNRFFDDNNNRLNYNIRVRKAFVDLPISIGASVQAGSQRVPGMAVDSDENLYGVDLQLVAGRLGLRAEYVRGDTPATLVGLEPEPAAAFAPGTTSSGAAAFFNYSLTDNDDIYWRYDHFEHDPVTGADIDGFNVGYLRRLGPNSQLSVDYQTKSGVTFNDDALNTKLSMTWNVTY